MRMILQGILFAAFLFSPCIQQALAEVVLGDVSYDNQIGLEEAISALATVSGESGQENLKVTAVYSADGTYQFDDESNKITTVFTQTTFPDEEGPPVGTVVFDVTFNNSNMVLTEGGNVSTWVPKKEISGSEITGVWEMVVDASGSFFRMWLTPDGKILLAGYMAGYSSSTVVFYPPVKTIQIDGNFTDWSAGEIAYSDTDGPDCNNAPGQDLQKVYIAQDASYIYIRYVLNGPLDVDFGYKFGQILHSYVGKTSGGAAYMFYTTPFPGVYGDYPPDTDVAITGNEIEFRLELCAANWDNVEIDAWLDDHNINTGQYTCQDHADLPEIEIDRSYCN